MYEKHMSFVNVVKHFLFQEIIKQRSVLFLWAPVFVAIGILIFFKTDVTLSEYSLVGGAFLSVLAIYKSYFLYKNHGLVIHLVALLASIAGCLIIVGYGSAYIRTASLSIPILEDDMPVIMIKGHIEKLVNLDGGKAKRIIINNVTGEGIDTPLRVRLKTYHFKGDEWRNGDVVTVKAKLLSPGGPVMPGGFDFHFKAKYSGISAVGYTLANATMITQSSSSNVNHVQSFRDHIGRILYQYMPNNSAGIAQALLTGERSGIAKKDVEALRVSGLAHLLAISGLHIGLVAGCVFFFVRLLLSTIPSLSLHYPIKKWAACCAIAIALSYMILAGATVPTVRAFIMTSFVLLAIILDRSAINMRLVALAAIFIMITTPEMIMGPSFVLSFAAVSALIVFYQGAGREWITNANAYKPLYRPVYYVIGVIVTTVIATLATAPFSIMFFNRLAAYSVIANIWAMPLMAFIVMPFGLLATLLSPLTNDLYLWEVMEWGINSVITIAHAVTNMDGSDLRLPSYGSRETFMTCAGFIWLVIWKGWLRWLGVVVMIIAAIMAWNFTPSKVLISEKMDAILIVDKSVDKLFLIGKMNGYLRNNWLGSLGYDPSVDILNYNDGDKIYFSTGYCDDFICRLNMNGTNTIILLNPIATQNACSYDGLTINITPKMTRFCPDNTVIDRFYVWRHGATSIIFNEDNKYAIQTVSGDNHE